MAELEQIDLTGDGGVIKRVLVAGSGDSPSTSSSVSGTTVSSNATIFNHFNINDHFQLAH